MTIRTTHPRCLFGIVLSLIGVIQFSPIVVGQELPITPIIEVMASPRDQAGLRRPVRLRGTVSLVGDGISSAPLHKTARISFCVEDETAGIWVRSGHALREGIFQGSVDLLDSLEYGVDIELEGLVDPRAFAPVIMPTRITILGKSELPAAPRTLNRRFLNGADEFRRVKVNGVVQSIIAETPECWSLRVETGVGHFLTRVPKEPYFAPKRLLDAEIEIVGLATDAWNWRSEFVCPRLIINRREDFQILRLASTDPFAVKKVAIENLDGYSVTGRPRHRRRIEGTVTYYNGHLSLYVQDGNTGVHVKTVQPVPIEVGDRVEVSGFIDKSGYLAGLRGALVRVLREGEQVDPVPMTIAQIVSEHQGVESGKPAVSHSCDGLLIELSGRLLDFQLGLPPEPHRLQLGCGESVVTAFLTGGTRSLVPGTELSVAGIAKLEYSLPPDSATLAQFSRVDLLLRSTNDITVIGRPSWWTSQRMFSGLLIAVGIAIVAFFWAFTLRRTLKRQTDLIAVEMKSRRDVAVEFQAAIRERTRLAANLHDTLLQNMAGIAYQIEACEPSGRLEQNAFQNHLKTARQMVQHSQDDIRNTVWALHCLPLSDGTFAESVERVIRRIGLGRDTKISIKCAENFPPLADFIAGNLLLVIQESIQNAIKHANSKRIDVELDVSPAADRVSIMIRDQGNGFDIHSRLTSSDGHFGLEGMERRIERLGGNLKIESRDGEGTVVNADVPLREFDPKII